MPDEKQPVLTATGEALTQDETPVMPWGLGEAVGVPGPFPYRLRLPVQNADPAEATFWLHPYHLGLAGKLKEAGANPDLTVSDQAELEVQHRVLAPLIIDRKKGWDNLIRLNGTEWVYQPPGDDVDGGPLDPRVQLSQVAWLFNLLKAEATRLTVRMKEVLEGNSEISPEPVTDLPANSPVQ
jgi:hypothetical protein